MSEVGIDIAGKSANRVYAELLMDADLVLTMTRFHREMLLSLFLIWKIKYLFLLII